jgi:hypothetical protein
MLIVLGILEGALSLLCLRLALAGAAQEVTGVPFGLLLMGVRILGLTIVCLYSFPYLRSLKLMYFVAAYILIGVHGGLMLFSGQAIILTVFMGFIMVSQKKLYWFDFAKTRDELIFMGLGAVICLAVSTFLRLRKGVANVSQGPDAPPRMPD